MLSRDEKIDILRGIAIFFMILANFSPYFIDNPPFVFRFLYTFAAPIFILLSNFMITYNHYFKNYNYSYYFKRGLYIIFWAIFVDSIIYRIFPFCSFDVLYLIGFSIIVNSLFFKLSHFLIFIISNAIFIITPFLQIKYGYIDLPIEAKLFDLSFFKFVLVNYSLKHFLIDGYFPIFPFLGIALMGIFFFNLYYNKRDIFFNKYFFIFIFFVFLILSIRLYNIKDILIIRDGYAELFYPPTLDFIYWSLSLIFLLFYILLNLPNSLYANDKLLSFFNKLGKHSLFIYVFHLFFAEYIFTFIEKYFNIYNTNYSLFLLIISFILFLLILNYVINLIEKQKTVYDFK
ncbi:MAG: DUF1624 domain-containing protein [bacterium]|nr:DUF1624 domain-containing protein [bacterium]